MKLICNLSMLGMRPTGLGVFSTNCVNRLSERYDLDLIVGSDFVPRGNVLSSAPQSIAIDSGRLASVRRYLWARSINYGPERLIYSPTHHGLPNQPRQIITIHDLIHYNYIDRYWHIYFYFRFLIPRMLKKCRSVFTVSEATRSEIGRVYGYPLERIFVVPNGVNKDDFSPDPSARPSDPYLLMVGGRHPHKNVVETLKMSDFWKGKYRLIIASCNEGSYRSKLENLVDERSLSNCVEFKGYLSHKDLVRLYQGATALVYPSLIEGFGIPPLESLACGTPVIASDIPVHREVLAEAGIFVRLGDPSSWQNAFNVLEDRSLVTGFLDNGKLRLEKYSWDNATDALEQALLSVEPRLSESRL